MTGVGMGELIHCDCLDVMRGMDAGSVDLIYADPPYCTQKDWGEFDDRWESFEVYLVYMEERLYECRRVLSDTGSFYLHVDPNTSHYLKVMLDGIFGRKNFRNEIVWCYTTPSGARKKFQPKHDVILWFSKGAEWIFNADAVRVPYKEIAARKAGMLYKLSAEKIQEYYVRGRIPRDWWDDIVPAGISDNKKCDYPTQKPIVLLERIVQASSNPGDLILDPFCGSGTTLAAAQQLGRRWIGVDQNSNAISLCEKRLSQTQPALIAA